MMKMKRAFEFYYVLCPSAADAFQDRQIQVSLHSALQLIFCDIPVDKFREFQKDTPDIETEDDDLGLDEDEEELDLDIGDEEDEEEEEEEEEECSSSLALEDFTDEVSSVGTASRSVTPSTSVFTPASTSASMTSAEREEANRAEDRKLLALMAHFNDDQLSRFESFRRTTFTKSCIGRVSLFYCQAPT